MIAVLIDSRKVGTSGWINVRSTQKILVQGMEEGDHLIIYSGDTAEPIVVMEDCEIPLTGQKNVRAEIVKISETSRISVDLE